MAKKDKDGNWIDGRGVRYPPELIPAIDQERDAMVERVHAIAKSLESALLEGKLAMLNEVQTYLAARAKSGKVKEGWKGNVQLKSFDGSIRVDQNIDDVVGFSEQLQMVKTTIDEWIGKRMDGIDPSLSKVITMAFNVDKKNRVNTAMIMRLLHLDIDDPLWKKAMKLLRESISVTSTRQYVNVYERIVSDTGEEMRLINLNFSNISVNTIPPES